MLHKKSFFWAMPADVRKGSAFAVRHFQLLLRLRLNAGGAPAGYFSMATGKAEPFRISGGTAAILRNISHYKSRAVDFVEIMARFQF